METGDIEVVPSKVTVLGKCQYNELPFQIDHSKEADENTRLKYRYLDLRNPAVKAKIVLRSKIVADLRAAMIAHDFMEITTPILTCSSPEGARDYLVPSRNHPGKFYALPQAPQQFKQLLMASGFDRYFQIAPCFRDEDARADRSPGEFYQLDMEMAFASQEDVFAIMEDVLPPIFAKYGIHHKASEAPFMRIPYLEAMEKYGSDKPDLRIDLLVQDATAVLADCGFEPFAGKTVKALVAENFTGTRKQIDKMCADVEVVSAQKTYWFRLDENGELVGGISKFVQEKKAAVKDFALTKGLAVALLAGVMSACFNLGLESGNEVLAKAKEAGASDLFALNPVILLVTLGGFCTNAVYCIFQNVKNGTGKDYFSVSGGTLLNNVLFCALAGVLWYSQFFGLGMGKSYFSDSPVMLAFSWSILMSLNVIFSNVWGILLKEWKGVDRRTIVVLITGMCILILSLLYPNIV